MTSGSTSDDRLDAARRGVLVGLAVGVLVGGLGEVATWLVLASSPTADVAIAGFSAAFGIPSSAALGGLLGWWGRPRRRAPLTLAAAVPAAVVATAQVVLQVLSL